jgi:hypothetical protein
VARISDYTYFLTRKSITVDVMTDVSKTTPRRVLQRAFELGVHADCVAADIDGACEACVLVFNQAFHELYGHAKDAGEALQLIIDDVLEDRQND